MSCAIGKGESHLVSRVFAVFSRAALEGGRTLEPQHVLARAIIPNRDGVVLPLRGGVELERRGLGRVRRTGSEHILKVIDPGAMPRRFREERSLGNDWVGVLIDQVDEELVVGLRHGAKDEGLAPVVDSEPLARGGEWFRGLGRDFGRRIPALIDEGERHISTVRLLNFRHVLTGVEVARIEPIRRGGCGPWSLIEIEGDRRSRILVGFEPFVEVELEVRTTTTRSPSYGDASQTRRLTNVFIQRRVPIVERILPRARVEIDLVVGNARR